MVIVRGSIIVSLLAVAAGFALAAARAEQVAEQQAGNAPARSAPIPVHEVRPGKLKLAVEARGTLEASRMAEIYCGVEGQTTIVSLVPEGQRVRKGDLVCELESAGLRDQLANQEITGQRAGAAYQNARLAREVAEIAVTEYEEGVYKQDLYALKSQIAGAEAAIQKASDRLERTRRAGELMKEAARQAAGKVAKTPADILAELDIVDRLEAAERAVQTERKALELARSRLDVLQKYTRDKTTKALKVEAERKRTEELARKEAWMLEKSKSEKLGRQIAACKILAPGDGVVVHASDPIRRGRRLQIAEGATVRERQKILSVVDLTAPLQVNAKVPESKVDRVVRGLRARVTLDGLSTPPLSGSVESVAVLPDPYAVATWDTKVYTTKVKLDKPLPGLRPGQTARAEIVIRELDNVRCVPVQAVVRFDGKDQVAVRNAGGDFAWRPVILGESSDQLIEIKQGVSAGEVVALVPGDLMTEEQKRQVRSGPGGAR